MKNIILNAETLKFYASFKKNEKSTLEIDKKGNVKIVVGKMLVGGVK